MRFTPRSAALATLAAINVFAVLAVGFLPGAIADSPAESPGAADMSMVGQPLLLTDLMTPEAIATDSPTDGPTASPTLDLTPAPSPTHKPTAKPKPKPRVKATPLPDTVAGARQYVKNAIGLKQYNCVDHIWTRESKWNPLAGTPTGAYGIPQAFPGSKMRTFGANWQTSPLTQVKWGIWYVNTRYGSACEAYQFWLDHGWY